MIETLFCGIINVIKIVCFNLVEWKLYVVKQPVEKVLSNLNESVENVKTKPHNDSHWINVLVISNILSFFLRLVLIQVGTKSQNRNS